MPKVLIIEDNDVALNLVRTGLRHDPAWEILFATDGERGLNLALEHLHDLNAIILDVFLPRGDGRDVLTRIRSAAPALPIIAVSGNDDALEDMRARGATVILPKPVSGERYAEVLRALVPARNGQRAAAGQMHASFDRTPLLGMHVLDLDIGRIQRHIQDALERRRYSGPSDWQEFLLSNGGAVEDGDTLRPTIAGMLAFAPRPERWLLANGVDVAEFTTDQAHSTTIRFQQPIRGDIFSVIERTVDLLWARIDHASTLDAEHGVTQLQTDAYPHIVLRELTVNALCHRDWSLEGAVVRIPLFPNRVEWLSPGGLPAGVRVDELRDAQYARNPALAQLLYQAGVIERFGLGLDTVFDTLAARGHPPPEMIDLGHAFRVRVFARPIVEADAQGQKQRNTPDDLTRRQQRLLNLLSDTGEHSAADLAAAIGESKWTVIRELNTLLEKGQIESVGAARATRYRRRS